MEGASAGVAKWLKAQGLGPCHEGVRGFDSRPPHNLFSAIDFALDGLDSKLNRLHLSDINEIDTAGFHLIILPFRSRFHIQSYRRSFRLPAS